MLAPELTPRTARRRRRKGQRDDYLACAHEQLFLMLATLRAASAEALHTLYFAEHPDGGASLRATYRWLAALEAAELLERQVIHGKRGVYRMTHRAYTSSPRVMRRATDRFRHAMPPAIAGYAWMRASIWAEPKNRGYRVGRGRDELRATRRFLIDNQKARVAMLEGPERRRAEHVLETLRSDPTLTPLFRSHCGACGSYGPLNQALTACAHCGAKPSQVASELRFECPECGRVSDGDDSEHESARDKRRKCTAALRETDHVLFDVAWREGPAGMEVTLIVVDDPGRTIPEQLNVLPLRVAGQPIVPVVLRTTDENSVFDSIAGTWIATGARHRELLRAFSEDGDRRLFPFSKTAKVIDVRADLQLRLRPSHPKKSEA